MGELLNLGLFPAEADSAASEPSGSSTLGAVAEFIACAALAQIGCVVHHVPSTGYDVIADVGGRLVRVQVKGTAKAYGRFYASTCKVEHAMASIAGKERQRVRVPLSAMHCDVVALVSLDKRRVAFLPIEEVSGSGYAKVPVSDFNHPDIERLSWLRSIE